MNRAELIEQLAANHDLPKSKTKALVDELFDTIMTTVKKGDTASFVGFGTFKQHQRAARKGFNPREGKAIKIAAQKVPKFTAGAGFKALVDPKAAARKKALSKK